MAYAVRDRVEVRVEGAWRPGTVVGTDAAGRSIVQVDSQPGDRFALTFVRATDADVRPQRPLAPTAPV